MRPYLTAAENEALTEFKKALVDLLGGSLLMLRLFDSKARGDYSESKEFNRFYDEEWRIALDITKEGVNT